MDLGVSPSETSGLLPAQPFQLRSCLSERSGSRDFGVGEGAQLLVHETRENCRADAPIEAPEEPSVGLSPDDDEGAFRTKGMLQEFPAAEHPHLAETIVQHINEADWQYGDEFAFGLELILGGLERLTA